MRLLRRDPLTPLHILLLCYFNWFFLIFLDTHVLAFIRLCISIFRVSILFNFLPNVNSCEGVGSKQMYPLKRRLTNCRVESFIKVSSSVYFSKTLHKIVDIISITLFITHHSCIYCCCCCCCGCLWWDTSWQYSLQNYIKHMNMCYYRETENTKKWDHIQG